MGGFDPTTATPDAGSPSVFDPKTAQPVEEKTRGYLPNFAAGFGEAVTGGLDLLDQAVNPYRTVADLMNRKQMPKPGDKTPADPSKMMPVADQKFFNGLLGKIGMDPDSVEAKTLGERLSRFSGQGATAGLIGGPAGAAGRTLTGMVAGMAGGEAAEHVPDPVKFPVALFASLAAGVPMSMLQTGVSKIPGQIKNATTLARAGASNDVAETVAGKVLAQNATDADAVKAGLDKGSAAPKIPGSEPTTFQASGDMGLGALERSTAVKNPQLFGQRDADQNAARITALNGVAPGANPVAVADYFRKQLGDLDAKTAANIEDRLNLARQTTAQVGGDVTPESLGNTMRDAVASAESKARADERGLWKAVDPDSNLTGNVKMTSAKADDVVGKMRKTEKPMEGEEAAVFNAASDLPAVAPVADLIALRSRVSTAMRDELTTNGRTPSYARLATLRGTIQDNLANTISEAATAEAPSVASGALAAEDSITARVAQWRQGLEAQRDAFMEQRQAAGGGVTSSAPISAGPGGGAGLPAAAPGAIPTFDAAAGTRLQAATAATKERAGTFGNGPVGDVLRKAGDAGTFRLADAGVPAKVFHGGARGFEDAQAFLEANRPSENFVGPNRGVAILTDAAAQSLRRAAMTEDGIMDPRKVMLWQNKYQDALRALPPEITDQFMNARNAATAVAEAQLARTEALAVFRQGKVGQLLGVSTPGEVSNIIGQTFSSPQSATLMRGIADSVKGDAEAVAGLKQAVADHISKKFIGNTEVGTSGVSGIKANAFQTFVKDNEPALRAAGFRDADMDSLKAIAEDIRQAKRSQNAVRLSGGSNTAQDTYAVSKQASVLSKIWQDIVAGGFGASAFLAGGGPLGAGAAWLGTRSMQALRDAGIANVDQLVTKAMLDPVLARRLLDKAPAVAMTPVADAAFARAVRRSITPAAIVAANTSNGARQ